MIRWCAVAMVALALASCAPAENGLVVTRDVPYSDSAVLDVYARPGTQDAPVFVLLHGCCGDRRDLAQFARGLAAEGAVVFNVSWPNLPGGGSYPTVYHQAACATRFARSRATGLGGNPGRVTLVGWSDGAMLAAAVASAGDDFGGFGEGCALSEGSALPDAFVGVAGFLGWPVGTGGEIDGRYVNDRTTAFFGGDPHEVPRAWEAGNPYTHLPRRPDLKIGLVVGADDALVADNEAFASAARSAGHPVDMVVVHAAGHLDLLAPSTAQGAAAVREALRMAAA